MENTIQKEFNIELKADNSICGYATKWGTRYTDNQNYDEILLRSAVEAELKRKDLDVLARVQHLGVLNVIGRTLNNTLALKSDNIGLFYQIINLPDTTAAKDIAVLVKGGYITKSSMAWTCQLLNPDWTDWDFSGEKPLAIYKKIVLDDVAPVSTPASELTSCFMKAKEQHLKAKGTPIEVNDVRKSIVEKLAMAREVNAKKYFI